MAWAPIGCVVTFSASYRILFNASEARSIPGVARATVNYVFRICAYWSGTVGLKLIVQPEGCHLLWCAAGFDPVIDLGEIVDKIRSFTSEAMVDTRHHDQTHILCRTRVTIEDTLIL